jgi:hypothetical protein
MARPQRVRRVGEAGVDGRRRIALERVGRRENDEGEILLVPVASVPVRELLVWENRKVRESLVRGMEDAAAGRVRSLGSFAELADEA